MQYIELATKVNIAITKWRDHCKGKEVEVIYTIHALVSADHLDNPGLSMDITGKSMDIPGKST
jgi:hypothetical protein